MALTQSLCGPTIGHLKLNAEKCKIITVIRAYYRLAHIHNLLIGGRNQDLNRVSQQKDLGVLVDSDLSFENHEQS